MRDITVDEFMDRAASLKGNVGELIAQENNQRQGIDYDLQERPVVVPLGNIFRPIRQSRIFIPMFDLDFNLKIELGAKKIDF